MVTKKMNKIHSYINYWLHNHKILEQSKDGFTYFLHVSKKVYFFKWTISLDSLALIFDFCLFTSEVVHCAENKNIDD